MRKQIEFKNPGMKQYEKQSGGILPMLVVIVVLALAGKFLFGAEAHLPHAELTRWLPAGGTETVLLDCQPEATAGHFFCKVEKFRSGDSVATAVIDEKAANLAVGHFFQVWPTKGATRSTASGRKSLSWTVSDGERSISGEAVWRDAMMDQQTTAVLSLEGALRAQLVK